MVLSDQIKTESTKQKRNTYTILVGKSEEKKFLARPTYLQRYRMWKVWLEWIRFSAWWNGGFVWRWQNKASRSIKAGNLTASWDMKLSTFH